jgi:hypothetical protein
VINTIMIPKYPSRILTARLHGAFPESPRNTAIVICGESPEVTGHALPAGDLGAPQFGSNRGQIVPQKGAAEAALSLAPIRRSSIEKARLANIDREKSFGLRP